jgi:hypothetical protein
VAARRAVVVEEVGTAAPEFLAAALFAIHVAMQRISIESIAKCSIENEIVKSTNLKDNLLPSEGLSVEVVPRPHCIILLPLLSIPPPRHISSFCYLRIFLSISISCRSSER